MLPTEISDNVYWVGAVDWSVRDFHGYSTPSGTTYNSFLLRDEKTVLFDAVKEGFEGDLLAHIAHIVDPAAIDYIVVNHVEPDHSGALSEVVDLVRPEKLICSAMGKKALLAHFHREDWPYEVVKTGDTISVGSKTLRFIETRMLHWPDSMFSYVEEDRLLISQDAFGQHWATSERFDDEVDHSELMYQSAKYYANILLPYSHLVTRLVSEIDGMGLAIDTIAPDHGLIWRSGPAEIVQAYRQWATQQPSAKVIVVYDTMWRSTEMMARAVVDGLHTAGVSVRLMSLAACHRADIVTELLDAKAVVFGTSTLNNNMLPRMADLLCYLRGLRPANKIGAAFGSYGWGGEAVKQVYEAMADMKIEAADPGVRVNYVPTAEDLARCRDMGARIGEMAAEAA